MPLQVGRIGALFQAGKPVAAKEALLALKKSGFSLSADLERRFLLREDILREQYRAVLGR